MKFNILASGGRRNFPSIPVPARTSGGPEPQRPLMCSWPGPQRPRMCWRPEPIGHKCTGGPEANHMLNAKHLQEAGEIFQLCHRLGFFSCAAAGIQTHCVQFNILQLCGRHVLLSSSAAGTSCTIPHFTVVQPPGSIQTHRVKFNIWTTGRQRVQFSSSAAGVLYCPIMRPRPPLSQPHVDSGRPASPVFAVSAQGGPPAARGKLFLVQAKV
jgi:hypothetical protein